MRGHPVLVTFLGTRVIPVGLALSMVEEPESGEGTEADIVLRVIEVFNEEFFEFGDDGRIAEGAEEIGAAEGLEAGARKAKGGKGKSTRKK